LPVKLGEFSATSFDRFSPEIYLTGGWWYGWRWWHRAGVVLVLKGNALLVIKVFSQALNDSYTGS